MPPVATGRRLGGQPGKSGMGLHRFEHEKHVVFYRAVTGGIRISRALHQRTLSSKSHFEA